MDCYGPFSAMKRAVGSWIGVASLVAVALVGVPTSARAGRIPCADVINEVDRVDSQSGARSADPVKVARRLKIDPRWVERCAEAYGRRLAHRAPDHGVGREDQDEQWEEQEPEEVSREEQQAQGETYEADVREEKRVSRLPNAPPDTHEWSPTFGKEWSEVMPPDWKILLHDDDLPAVAE